ncbi:MAG: haloacid dehalogenase [Micrococcales bacterium 73-13]|nr:MAG: haloacid dehalogenase [Micrococcales bacterium 73-13]
MIEAGSPLDGVDVLLADLDGVLYAAADPIPYAVDAVNAAVADGVRVGYITNNAARIDARVAEQLRGFGLDVAPRDVVTSPQAAVDLLRDVVPPGARILVVGGEGITHELELAGYRTTSSAEDRPAAVLQGFHPSVGWEQLAEASFAIRGLDIPWIATNQDWTIPHSRGVAPGNGTLVAAVHTATGRMPIIAGKPERAIFDTAIERLGARRPLVVGDRLDTDVLGANRAGIPGALVLTGIDGPKQLVAAAPEERPAYILDDLRELFTPYPMPRVEDGVVRVRDAAIRLDGHRIEVLAGGTRHTDLVRAACAVIWGSGLAIYAFEVPEAVYTPPRAA